MTTTTDSGDQTDEEIARLVQQGEKEQFGTLMKRYEKKLSRYGTKFLSSKDNIDDIVQDVFISTFKNIHSFNLSLKFSPWIYRIAHNAFVNKLKQQRMYLPSFDFDTLVSHLVYEDPKEEEREYEAMQKMIEIGLEALKPKYREIIILHYLEDFSYKKISDILQVPIGTVGIRVKRGREMLKKICEKMNQEHYER